MIELRNFSFQYDAQSELTLKGINLRIEKGEKVLIVGASGSGKSTLGHCLNGIIPNIYKGSHQGELLIDGRPAFDLSIYEKSQLISTVLQDPDGQFIGLSVAEDLAFALENDCVTKEEMIEKITLWSERLELSEFLDYRPQDLSGGQKQRVSLAGVLIDESPILLFDEPLASLDPKAGQDTIELIDRIHQENEVTTIIIEHRLEDVLHRPVDRIVLMSEGEIVFNGNPNDLLSTHLLTENGIREPLYISVLRDLDYNLVSGDNLANLASLDLSSISFERNCRETQPLSRETIIEVEQLGFAYSKRPILKNISFKIAKGERLAIVGKNGAGKSTLAKALTKSITADGLIRIDGQDVSGDTIKERAERIGYVLQNPNQMISQNMIFDEIALGLRLRGIPEEEVTERVHKVMETCGLYPFRNWPISALSFGQKKRVTIASILVLNPKVILLDEPTAGQDKGHYIEIMRFLDELQQKGHTIVIITHDMQLLLEYSDRCLVVAEGEILADTTPAQLFTKLELLEKGNLKATSLYELAEKLQVDPVALTQFYRDKQGGQV